MEEDKKILNFLLEHSESVLLDNEADAIIHILNKLEELEKENKELEADLYAANCIISDQIDVIRDLKDIQQQICNEELINQEYCIKKSKIEDKIKELEEQFDYYINRDSYAYEDGEFDGETIDDLHSKIQILKSILEE